MDKRSFSERDICTKLITLALRQAGWGDEMLQIREEVGFTKGRIIVRGKLITAAMPAADTSREYKMHKEILSTLGAVSLALAFAASPAWAQGTVRVCDR